MNKIKMIGLDLDGTLLNEKKELTEYTRDVLNRAIDQGVTVLVATGRPITGVPKELIEFPGMRYVLTANGGRIIDLKEKKIIYEELVKYEDAVNILKIFEKYQTFREIYFDGLGYTEWPMLEELRGYFRTAPMMEYIKNTRRGIDSIWEKMEEMKGHGLDKVHGVFSDMTEHAKAFEDLKKLGNFEVSNALGNNLEVNAPGVNKGTGLLRLGEMLGICREEIMACGDGNNDLAMIKTVGFGVAMENGFEEVKEAADYVTVTNDEDGVAKAIEKFVL